MTIVENVHFQQTGCGQLDSHWGRNSVGGDSAKGWQPPPSRVALERDNNVQDVLMRASRLAESAQKL